jgi:hypothetical protein
MMLPLFLLPSVLPPEDSLSHARRHPSLHDPFQLPHRLTARSVTRSPIPVLQVRSHTETFAFKPGPSATVIDRGALLGLLQLLFHKGKGCFDQIYCIIGFWFIFYYLELHWRSQV